MKTYLSNALILVMTKISSIMRMSSFVDANSISNPSLFCLYCRWFRECVTSYFDVRIVPWNLVQLNAPVSDYHCTVFPSYFLLLDPDIFGPLFCHQFQVRREVVSFGSTIGGFVQSKFLTSIQSLANTALFILAAHLDNSNAASTDAFLPKWWDTQRILVSFWLRFALPLYMSCSRIRIVR